jgi:uncharacterized RDD family membrane protein YckC
MWDFFINFISIIMSVADEIEITTTQNITVHYDLAGVWERVIAFFLDAMILTVCSSILYAIFCSGDEDDVMQYFTVIPFIMLYSLGFELLNNGQSIGKMALKLRVIRIDGQKVTFPDYMMRWMFRLMDIYASVGSVAFLGIISSSNNQRVGDLLANTVVVSLKKDYRITLSNLLKLNDHQKYQPQYPQVLRLSEETMLIVKEVLKKKVKYPNEAHQQAYKLLLDKISKELEIKVPKNKEEFLKTLIKDYVFLTR